MGVYLKRRIGTGLCSLAKLFFPVRNNLSPPQPPPAEIPIFVVLLIRYVYLDVSLWLCYPPLGVGKGEEVTICKSHSLFSKKYVR